ncbi:hypothetical protein GCM10009543_19050 [Leifsonia naganoensis]
MGTLRLRVVRALSVAAVIASAGGSPACTQTKFEQEGHLMKHEEAKAEVEKLYEQTLAIVGDGWDAPSSASWGACGKWSLGKDRDSWSRFTQRFGQLEEPPEEIAARVAELWNGLGYAVRVVADDTLTPPRKVVSYPGYLAGTTSDGFGALFTVGDGYADFSAGSRCVPSDPDLEGQVPS